MQSFCKDPTYENFLFLSDDMKYALVNSLYSSNSSEASSSFSIENKSSLQSLLKAYLFSYRKEEEKKIFDLAFDTVEFSLDCVTVYSSDIFDKIWGKYTAIFSVEVDSHGNINICFPDSPTDIDLRFKIYNVLKNDQRYELAKRRFEEIIKYVVVGDVVFTKSDDPYEAPNYERILYTRENSFTGEKKDQKDDEKSPIVPSIYKQDLDFFKFVNRYNFCIANIMYENYISSANLNLIFSHKLTGRLIEHNLKDLILRKSNTKISFFDAEEKKEVAPDEKDDEKFTFSPLSFQDGIQTLGVAVKMEIHDEIFTFIWFNGKKILLDPDNEVLEDTEDTTYEIIEGIDFDFFMESLSYIHRTLYNKK